MKTYDVIIVGAGIAGASCAYFLKEKNLSVLVLDRAGIAKKGGSSAAGAFVSPKIGKGSILQTLTNEAFDFSKNFYIQNFPDYFHQTGVIRIPKDEEDALKFKEYEQHDSSSRIWYSKKSLENIGVKNPLDSFLFDQAGVCDAPELCNALLEGIEYQEYDVKSLIYEDDLWHIGKFKSKKLVLATGYENNFFDMRYMGVKGTWGTRGDYESSLSLKNSMHKKISISANMNGIIKIGATHEKEVNSCVHCGVEPLQDLLSIASSMVNTSDFKLKNVFCGMRAGAKDYFPLVGEVISVNEVLEKYPKLPRGEKLKEEPIKIDHLYVLNGLGGRGFVFAPMLASMLAEKITNNKAIDERVNPDRLFLKWCRKSNDLEGYRQCQ